MRFWSGAIMLALRPVLGAGFQPVDLRKIAFWFGGLRVSVRVGAFFRALEDSRCGRPSAAYLGRRRGERGAVAGAGYNNTPAGGVPVDRVGYMMLKLHQYHARLQ